jgi:hypothetical protein
MGVPWVKTASNLQEQRGNETADYSCDWYMSIQKSITLACFFVRRDTHVFLSAFDSTLRDTLPDYEAFT